MQPVSATMAAKVWSIVSCFFLCGSFRQTNLKAKHERFDWFFMVSSYLTGVTNMYDSLIDTVRHIHQKMTKNLLKQSERILSILRGISSRVDKLILNYIFIYDVVTFSFRCKQDLNFGARTLLEWINTRNENKTILLIP